MSRLLIISSMSLMTYIFKFAQYSRASLSEKWRIAFHSSSLYVKHIYKWRFQFYFLIIIMSLKIIIIMSFSLIYQYITYELSEQLDLSSFFNDMTQLTSHTLTSIQIVSDFCHYKILSHERWMYLVHQVPKAAGTNYHKLGDLKQQGSGLPWSPIVRTLPSNAGDLGAIPGHGIKTPHATWYSQ